MLAQSVTHVRADSATWFTVVPCISSVGERFDASVDSLNALVFQALGYANVLN